MNEKQKWYKNKNVLIVAAIVAVIAVVFVISLTMKKGPSIAPDALPVDLLPATEEPAANEDPAATEPAATEGSVANEGAASTEELVELERPSVTEAPAVTEEPAATGEPETNDGLVELQKPVASETTEEPAATDAPADAESTYTIGEHPAGYILYRLEAQYQYGWIPLPETGYIDFPITQTLPDGTEAENVLHVTPAGFHMVSSTCENQDCVGQGEVTLENRDERILYNSVICLPNQVMVELYTAQELEDMVAAAQAAEADETATAPEGEA